MKKEIKNLRDENFPTFLYNTEIEKEIACESKIELNRNKERLNTFKASLKSFITNISI